MNKDNIVDAMEDLIPNALDYPNIVDYKHVTPEQFEAFKKCRDREWNELNRAAGEEILQAIQDGRCKPFES